MKKENENSFIISSDRKEDDLSKGVNSSLDSPKDLTALTNHQKKKLRNIRKASRALDYIILILSLIALFIGAYAFWDTHQVMEIASSEEYAVYKPDSRKNLTFEELKNKNPDVIGWIDIYGTKIDYPIVQAKNNSEYLNKTVLGEFSTAGSIFLDHRNQKDFTDFQNIVYGHYMAERKMFGDMELFKDKGFFETHRYGVIHRDGEKSLGIEFFAFIKTVGTDQLILSPAKMQADKKDLVDRIYNNATYSRKIDFKESDDIVILDTCDLSITNGRYILVGKLSGKVYENTFKEKVSTNKFSKLLKKIYKFDALISLLILWILLVVIYLVYENIRRKNKGEEAKTNVQNNEKQI